MLPSSSRVEARSSKIRRTTSKHNGGWEEAFDVQSQYSTDGFCHSTWNSHSFEQTDVQVRTGVGAQSPFWQTSKLSDCLPGSMINGTVLRTYVAKPRGGTMHNSLVHTVASNQQQKEGKQHNISFHSIFLAVAALRSWLWLLEAHRSDHYGRVHNSVWWSRSTATG
jgi:hypothetical protein